MGNSKRERTEAAESRGILRDLFREINGGEHPSEHHPVTVWCVLRHVSPSGMTRWIDFYVIDSDRDPRRITHRMADVTGWTQTARHREALRVEGCGMDMGFHAVYVLAQSLYFGDSKDPRAGYALRSEWL